MWRVVVAMFLVFCALLARGQDLGVYEGGFAPRGGPFRVTFGFSNLAVARAQEPLLLSTPGLDSPAWEWSDAHGLSAQLEVCCLTKEIGLSTAVLAVARVHVANATDRPFSTTLVITVAPEGAIHGLAFERHAFFISGKPVLIADTPSRGAVLAESPFAPRSLTPRDTAHVESAKGECRGEMLYDLTLAPGQSQTLGFISPVRLPPGKEPGLDFYRALSVEELFKQASGASIKAR